MSTFGERRDRTLETLRASTIVGVVRDSEESRAGEIVDGLLAGGLRALEITANTPGCFDLLARFSAKVAHPDTVLGVGTVRTVREVEAARNAGASFIVSPHTDEVLIRMALANGLVVIPGAMSPTEILTARSMGADVVKVFPIATAGGPRYVQLIRGPLGDVPIWVSGGVTLDDIPDYVSSGVTLIGLTTALTEDLPPDVKAGAKARAEHALSLLD